MKFLWTGEWPENRCPTLKSFHLDDKTAYDNIRLKVGEKYKVQAVVSDHENDLINYRWEILPESTDLGWGGDYESRPESLHPPFQ